MKLVEIVSLAVTVPSIALSDIALIAGPILGFISALIVIAQIIVGRRSSKDTVNVGAKEANTHEFEAILAGLKESLGEVKTARADDKREFQEQIDQMNGRLGIMEDERDAMIDHIMVVEALVPNPPGAPARPSWHKRTKRHPAGSK